MPSVASPQEAPRYPIPNERIVSVEHPCIVHNASRAIDMLGGGKPLSETLDHGSTKTLPLKFTPSSQSILSINNTSDNILLRITVPKATGKRKRGSTGSFQPIDTSSTPSSNTAAPTQGQHTASHLLRSLRDNPSHTTITPLGTISNSHIFRTLPGMIYSTTDSHFRSEVETKLLGMGPSTTSTTNHNNNGRAQSGSKAQSSNQNLDKIKSFILPHATGLQDTEMFPPPVLSTVSFPMGYVYVGKEQKQAPPSKSKNGETNKKKAQSQTKQRPVAAEEQEQRQEQGQDAPQGPEHNGESNKKTQRIGNAVAEESLPSMSELVAQDGNG
jgi:hypothetical protein